MTFYISNAAAQAMANAFAAQIDTGSGAGKLRIYSGSIPTDADAALGGAVLLADITLNDPAFAAAVDANPGARIDLDITPAVQDNSADASGTAAFYRMLDSDNVVRAQGPCATTPGAGALVMPTLTVTAGVAVPITSLSITMPES